MGYTVEQLEDMLLNAQLSESLANFAEPDHFIDEDAIINASDAEIETYMLTSGSFSINAGKRLKSSSENKHIIKQKYYIRETRNGETVAHALQDTVYITGSYSDNIADPTVQIIRTREIDMRILKG
tara:strand:+ start:4681 stop:5058 length:378 start_codon:yes stop_codon:yes gene_type:complete